MSIFNHNLRFLCKKMGLSQQKLADLLDVKRGKVAGYFYETQPKADFHEKLVNQFHLDLGKFLTQEMSESNYSAFFSSESEKDGGVSEPQENYQGSANAIDLLLQAKKAESIEERNKIIDEAIALYANLISENSQLKDQLMEAIKKQGN